MQHITLGLQYSTSHHNAMHIEEIVKIMGHRKEVLGLKCNRDHSVGSVKMRCDQDFMMNKPPTCAGTKDKKS